MIYQPEFNLTSYSLLYFNRGGRKKQSSEAGDARGCNGPCSVDWYSKGGKLISLVRKKIFDHRSTFLDPDLACLDLFRAQFLPRRSIC